MYLYVMPYYNTTCILYSIFNSEQMDDISILVSHKDNSFFFIDFYDLLILIMLD
jgi:hypothetical protein